MNSFIAIAATCWLVARVPNRIVKYGAVGLATAAIGLDPVLGFVWRM